MLITDTGEFHYHKNDRKDIMFKLNQLVLFKGYICQIYDINKEICCLLHIDGSKIRVKKNELYPYHGILCSSTFNKERNRNIRNNKVCISLLFSVFFIVTWYVNSILIQ